MIHYQPHRRRRLHLSPRRLALIALLAAGIFVGVFHRSLLDAADNYRWQRAARGADYIANGTVDGATVARVPAVAAQVHFRALGSYPADDPVLFAGMLRPSAQARDSESRYVVLVLVPGARSIRGSVYQLGSTSPPRRLGTATVSIPGTGPLAATPSRTGDVRRVDIDCGGHVVLAYLVNDGVVFDVGVR